VFSFINQAQWPGGRITEASPAASRLRCLLAFSDIPTMGHISIIFGNIIGASWKTHDYHKLQRLNKNVIDNLLDSDDSYPWINRNMFLVPDPDKDKMYRDQVIVFGASYKSIEHEWEEWIGKFEMILKQLYWTSATIHLDTELVGSHRYEWVFDIGQTDNWTSDKPIPTVRWDFNGGPRKFFENGSKIT